MRRIFLRFGPDAQVDVLRWGAARGHALLKQAGIVSLGFVFAGKSC